MYRLSSTSRTYFIVFIDSIRSVLYTSLHAVTLLIVSETFTTIQQTADSYYQISQLLLKHIYVAVKILLDFTCCVAVSVNVMYTVTNLAC